MIDIAKLAESALPGHPNAASIMATVAPVLVAAITDEVRKLHPLGFNLPWGIPVCTACDCIRPCPPLRLFDELDAALGVQR